MLRFSVRAEPTSSLEIGADRLVMLVLSYGLLVLVAYRSFALHEQAWDLMALLVGSGLIGFGYRLRGGAPMSRTSALALGAALVAAALAVLIALGVGR